MRIVALCIISVLCFGCEHPEPNTTSENAIPSQSTSFDLQGHRGARGLLPENTIPSFLKAIEFGVRTLELDVVISSDQQVVVSHEPWFSHAICLKPDGSAIEEAEEQRLNLYEMPYERIQQFDCGSIGNERFPEQQKMTVTKPLLSDVIKTIESHIRAQRLPPIYYNIETKSQPEGDDTFHPSPTVFTNLVIQVIESQGVTSRTTLQSFDPRTLQVAHTVAPDLSIALLVASHHSMGVEQHVERLGFTPEIYSPYFELVNSEVLQSVHEKGMLLIPWTVNEPEDMVALIDLGVDGLITDYPDRAQQVLQQN